MSKFKINLLLILSALSTDCFGMLRTVGKRGPAVARALERGLARGPKEMPKTARPTTRPLPMTVRTPNMPAGGHRGIVSMGGASRAGAQRMLGVAGTSPLQQRMQMERPFGGAPARGMATGDNNIEVAQGNQALGQSPLDKMNDMPAARFEDAHYRDKVNSFLSKNLFIPEHVIPKDILRIYVLASGDPSKPLTPEYIKELLNDKVRNDNFLSYTADVVPIIDSIGNKYNAWGAYDRAELESYIKKAEKILNKFYKEQLGSQPKSLSQVYEEYYEENVSMLESTVSEAERAIDNAKVLVDGFEHLPLLIREYSDKDLEDWYDSTYQELSKIDHDLRKLDHGVFTRRYGGSYPFGNARLNELRSQVNMLLTGETGPREYRSKQKIWEIKFKDLKNKLHLLHEHEEARQKEARQKKAGQYRKKLGMAGAVGTVVAGGLYFATRDSDKEPGKRSEVAPDPQMDIVEEVPVQGAEVFEEVVDEQVSNTVAEAVGKQVKAVKDVGLTPSRFGEWAAWATGNERLKDPAVQQQVWDEAKAKTYETLVSSPYRKARSWAGYDQ